MKSTLPTIEEVIADPGTSFWLKEALQVSLRRDPMDALNDASLLANLLTRHVEQIIARVQT